MQQNQQSSSSSQQPWGGPYPSLHMWPLHETFSTKMLYLPESQRIKIGRQTSNKTIPGERNAFFDSKVLSRLHAEVWEQGGKIFIKDIKSSNGTFINNERLSPESIESEPFELKSEDLVEFGIDIVSDDNRTIVHHKVAAKVYCVFNADDAALSARELANYSNQHRRPAAPTTSAPSVPAVMSAGGKPNGLNFDAVLSKLRDELSKSKETGAELQELAGSMTDIQETLGGGLPPSQNGSAAAYMPLQFRSNSAEAKAALAGPHGQQAAAFIALQNQLSDTQNSLNAHIERIKTLETGLHQNESIKVEVANLREQMEENKREIDMMVSGARGRTLNRRIDDDDDDDTRSVVTVMDNEDIRERMQDKRRDVNGENSPSRVDIEVVSAQNAELATKVEGLSSELTEAVRISRTLQSQHDEAMTAVKTLTERIGSLETGIATKIAEAVSESDKKWETWRTQIEEGWKKERDNWESERERLRSVVRDWEETSRRAVEENEDRALNERLSGEGSSDEDNGQTQKPNGRSSRKPKRRRPSTKTSLAVRALRDISNDGSSTPTQTTVPLKSPSALTGDVDVDLDDGAVSVLSDKSSESGKESVATLRDKDSGKRRARQAAETRQRNAVPVFTVVVVAVIAGALYFRHKD